MDGLVAVDAEDGAAEDLVGVGVDEELHEAGGLAHLPGASDGFHLPGTDQHVTSARQGLRVGHPEATERWVDEQPVAGDSVGNPTRVVVEQVGDNDLVIVVGGVRECTLPVAIAERPDPVDVRPQLVVDGDETACVGLDPDGDEAEVIGVGNPADSEQEMGADNLRRAGAALDVHSDARRGGGPIRRIRR